MSILDNCSPTAARNVYNVFKPAGPPSSPFTRPLTPIGLTRSKIYFSIVQRTVTHATMTSILGQGSRRLLSPSKISYEKSAAPFRWKFTREDLAKLMIRLNARAVAPAA